MNWLYDILYIALAAFLVLLNGFFVAAEFALVKVRASRLDELVREGRPFARTARWLYRRLDASLSSCQLGITMASLGLGWVGEPAFARLLSPVLGAVGISSPALVHSVAFVIAFTAITVLHLVVGEQAPKIYAIRRPEVMALWIAFPLKVFYIVSYPFLVALNASTTSLLRRVGIEGGSEHESPHSEDEIRAVIRQSRRHGLLSRTEHRLLDAVFEFDDLVCRKVMVARSDVDFCDLNAPHEALLELARRTRHTRYPVCDGSMDHVLGVLHVKDLIGIGSADTLDIRSVMRPPRFVPESMPISRLLRHFQASHNLMAFVVDEYGTVAGIVTLENVLEQIVGSVEDEFDAEPRPIVPDGPGHYVVHGATPVELVARELDLALGPTDVDTFSGYLVARLGHLPQAGDRVEIEGATVEILETKGGRAVRVRVRLVTGETPKDDGGS